MQDKLHKRLPTIIQFCRNLGGMKQTRYTHRFKYRHLFQKKFGKKVNHMSDLHISAYTG